MLYVDRRLFQLHDNLSLNLHMTPLHFHHLVLMDTWGDAISLRLLNLLMVVLLLSGCAVRSYVVNQTADVFSSQGLSDEDDLQLAREASAFYLKTSESLLRQTPGHLKLAEAVSAGFTQYAYAFVAFEAEKIDSNQPDVAAKMRERAARLYSRAYRHAMVALEKNQPGFAVALTQNDAKKRPKLKPAEVPLAYWSAASLGGKVSMSKDDPDVVADLPLSMRLAELAWQTDPTFGQGALSSLMGTLEAARVGGSRQKAERFFDQAIAMGEGKEAGPLVAKAEGVALPNQNKAQFEQLLQQALKVSQNHRSLQNEVMRERAQWLLLSADDLF